MQQHKRALLFALIGFLAVSVLLLAAIAGKSQIIRPRAVGENVGELFMQPLTLASPVSVNGTFAAGLLVNVGPANKLNIARASLTFDKTRLEVQSCTAGNGFQGVGTVAPCNYSNVDGTISLLLYSSAIDGPSGSPILATFTFKALANGLAAVTIGSSELVVKDASGASANFPITNSFGGSYDIGGTSPSVTQPPATATVTQPPTATITVPPPTATLPPNVTPTSCGPALTMPVWGGSNGVTRTIVDANNDRITLSWNAVTGATSYEISWGYFGANWSDPSMATTTTWEGLYPPSSNVSFRLIARNACGTSPTATTTSAPRVGDISPTPQSGNVTINFKLKFQGIAAKRDDKTVAFTLAGGPGNIRRDFPNVPIVSDVNGYWSGSITADVPLGGGYMVLIKGPMHLKRKYCDATAAPLSEIADYHCGSDGQIRLTAGVNELNFIRTIIYIGDLPPQDGEMNARDASELRLNLTKTDADALSRADVNFDGVVNTTDWSLIIESMQVNFDEEI